MRKLEFFEVVIYKAVGKAKARWYLSLCGTEDEIISTRTRSFPGSICEPAPCGVPLERPLQLFSLGDSLARPLGAFLGHQ